MNIYVYLLFYVKLDLNIMLASQLNVNVCWRCTAPQDSKNSAV